MAARDLFARGTRRERRLPGEAGVWVVVIGDLLAFAVLFGTFMVLRADHPEAFAAGQAAMDVDLGILNTLLLLTGSLMIARAVAAYRDGARDVARRSVVFTIVCGLVFVGVKVVEYRAKIDAGLVPDDSPFFLLYFTFTGIHLLHVLIGLVVLLYMRTLAGREQPDARDREAFESGATFWHMVDLLWLVLFALFYLVHA